MLYLAIGVVLLAAVAGLACRLDLLLWTGAVAVAGLIVYGPLLQAAAGSTVGG